ncbi:MAG: family 43 glycosylhydrolase [Clostridia bacterium]|nr:family 43 glycosylhydrolase [Clostridia bacterium]
MENSAENAVWGESLLTASDFPDPDVIRVGDAYFLASTTMHFSPGCAFLRSYDLIHWEWCGHLYAALDETDARGLKNGKNCYGKGMWAPSLRWHQGEYFVCFAVADLGRTRIYRTRDLENGPWEKIELPGLYYDPSLFFDADGKAYIIHGNGTVRLTELNRSLTGPQERGLDRVLVSTGPTRHLGYEGSHFYRVGDRYYLFTIHSLPDRWRRVESCFCADSLDGEFSGGILFNDDLGYHDQGIAQGGIVDTPDGRWYAVFFQDRGAVGRIPVLLPLKWKCGLPAIGVQGKAVAEISNATTRPGYAYAPLAASDAFDSPVLLPQWEWNHTPDESLFETGKGYLKLTAGRVDASLTAARNTLTVRGTYPGTEVTVRVDGSALLPGDRAGLCALQYGWSAVALLRTADGFQLALLDNESDPEGETVSAALPFGPKARLRAVFHFADMRDTVCYFYWDGDMWQALGAPKKMRFDLRHFAGARPGLFCYATKKPGGEARFDAFTYRVLEEEGKTDA